MQAIFVRPNWQAITQNIQQQRRRMLWVLLLSMLVILTLVGTVQRTVSRLALQAILADGGAWGLAWAVAVCYALRHRSECWRSGAITGLLVALIFTIVSIVPKWNVDTWMTESYKSNPILYWGVWHGLILGVVRWLTRRYPREMRACGLSLEHWRRNLMIGLLGGGVLAGHLLFSIAFTGAGPLHFPPLPHFFWQLSFEIASSLGSEFFFRGTVYHYFESERGWGHYSAALTAAAFNVSLFLVKVQWTDDIITVVGVLFYIFMLSMINATLYRLTRSLLPGYVSSLIFTLSATLER